MEQVTKRKMNDKIILTPESNIKLETWKSQFEKWNDIVSVTKSDFVNFILASCSDCLSVNEVRSLLKSIVNRSAKPKTRKPRTKKTPSQEAKLEKSEHI